MAQLQNFIRLLGWRGQLREYRHRPSEPIGIKEIIWYEVGMSKGLRTDFFLQINPTPQSQTHEYQAAVYARRYRIYTGWHGFRISGTGDELKREIARLEKLVAWKLFADIVSRRAYRKSHPDCALFPEHLTVKPART